MPEVDGSGGSMSQHRGQTGRSVFGANGTRQDRLGRTAAGSVELADKIRDYVLTAVDLFSPTRSMVESNFPVEMLWTSYGNQWNAFKRILAGFNENEKRDMFAASATPASRGAL